MKDIIHCIMYLLVIGLNVIIDGFVNYIPINVNCNLYFLYCLYSRMFGHRGNLHCNEIKLFHNRNKNANMNIGATISFYYIAFYEVFYLALKQKSMYL